MKKTVFLLLPVLLLTACSGASSNAVAATLVQMPDDARLLILGLVTSGLTALFAFAFNKWGLDLRGFTTELAAVLAGILVAVFEFILGLLSFIPDAILLNIIHLIVLVVSGYGVALVLNRFRTPGFRSVR